MGSRFMTPPPAFRATWLSSAPVKTMAPSARAIAASVMPKACARSMARLVGAEMATSVVAPKIAAFSTISNEARLVTTINPSRGDTPFAQQRADQLVERVVAADILAQRQNGAVARAEGGAMDGVGQRIEFLVAVEIGQRGENRARAKSARAGASGTACGNCSTVSTPHSPQEVRPAIARRRARCSRKRPGDSSMSSVRPLSWRPTTFTARISSPSGRSPRSG